MCRQQEELGLVQSPLHQPRPAQMKCLAADQDAKYLAVMTGGEYMHPQSPEPVLDLQSSPPLLSASSLVVVCIVCNN